MLTSQRRPASCGSVQCLWRSSRGPAGYATAVSLHSHTTHSREGLDFIPRIMRKVGVARAVLDRIDRQHVRRTGRSIGFDRAFWRPPLTPPMAHRLEAAQIVEKLGLRPLVSITDHDDIEACAALRAIGIAVPYSVEWTVPYDATVFHIGVHNLPPEHAGALLSAMSDYTRQPREPLLTGILAALDGWSDVLVVLNHPLIHEERLDRPSHVRLLMQFLAGHGSRIHALELNGLQPASDNREVMRLASEKGMLVISGGDRHCLEPNANLNLTNAASFSEFVAEVRRERVSQVLFMPQYRESIAARYIQFLWQAVKDYPELKGRERWVDRIFYQPFGQPGVIVPLSCEWAHGGPAALRGFISTVGFLAAPQMRAAMRLAFGEQGEVVA